MFFQYELNPKSDVSKDVRISTGWAAPSREENSKEERSSFEAICMPSHASGPRDYLSADASPCLVPQPQPVP